LKLLAHASPSILEAELLDRVAAAKAADPLAPVLIVVPSRRLVDHLLHRLVERFGAVLGITVLHHRALAERILESAGAKSRRVLDEDLLDTLFARVMDRASPGRLRDFARDHPGAASALRQTLTDLREAGIEPTAATDVLSGAEAEVASLYAMWSSALNELSARDLAIDDAGLARAAAAAAGAFAGGFALTLHHGAYDLIGVHVELVRALDRGRELTFLLPADPSEASGVFGVNRARAIAGLGSPVTILEREALPAPARFLHAQGARAELQSAAYDALAAVSSGTLPHEVAIVVRSFGPYAGALDALLDADGPSWHTSYTRPLRRDPQVAKALAVIASGGGGDALGWRAHADAFEAIAEPFAANAGLTQLFQSMREIETLLGDHRPVSRKEALSWLDARADAARRPPDGAGGGGVRILDAMQARGMTFAHVGLAGMNTGIFPQIAREDPFLSDVSRGLLREATGRPLPIAAERQSEEHLLLAMLLRQARQRLLVSWQRADEAARPIVPSLALRDIARFTRLGSDAADALRLARALPAHPRSKLTAWEQQPGLLTRRDETLLTALASETGAEAGPALAIRRPECGAGIALLAATETFEPTPGRYDGRIGLSALRDEIGVSALERLGRCPLQFFFRDVLRVKAPEPSPDERTADSAALGLRVHAALQEVFARLRDEGRFTGDAVDSRVKRAQELLREAWTSSAGEGDAARAVRLPLLERISGGIWLKTLDAFLEADLRRLADAGLAPEHLEREVSGAIPGDPTGVVIDARFDRVLRSPAGSMVSDYKTRGKLKDRVQPGAMLSGERLQVPLYALISGLPVELVGAGPTHDPSTDVVRFAGFESEDQHQGFLETLGVLIALAKSGRFPIHPGDHCDWCDYRSACRRGHPPTLFREGRATDVEDARACWSKTAKLPTMDAVRREHAP
jgi:RecB family exonuclease